MAKTTFGLDDIEVIICTSISRSSIIINKNARIGETLDEEGVDYSDGLVIIGSSNTKFCKNLNNTFSDFEDCFEISNGLKRCHLIVPIVYRSLDEYMDSRRIPVS